MKLLFACVVLLSAAAVVSVDARSHPADLLVQFKSWMTKYNKSYATTAAFDEAFHNYQATLRRVELKNLAQTKAGFAAGKFADLSPEQFRQRYLNLDGQKLRTAMANQQLEVTPPQPLTRTGGVLPTSFDWAMQNPSPLTYVKDQRMYDDDDARQLTFSHFLLLTGFRFRRHF